MNLTKAQLSMFEERGFLMLSSLLSTREIEVLTGELEGIFAEDTVERVMEDDGQTVRTVYGSHARNEVFASLARDPRLLCPPTQILGSGVYIHQFKINQKAAITGEKWDWHQDYSYWRKEDGFTQPLAVNAAVFLSEVTAANGPLLLIPGSHKSEALHLPTRQDSLEEDDDPSRWMTHVSAQLSHVPSDETIADLAGGLGLTSAVGPAGSVLFFHCNLLHASAANISPIDRIVVFISYNSVENIPTPPEVRRPAFLASRNYEEVAPLAPESRIGTPPT